MSDQSKIKLTYPTGSPAGKVNKADVGVSALEGAAGSVLSMIGLEMRDYLPFVAMSQSTQIVIVIAIVSFVLIFLGRLWSQRVADNRLKGG